MKYVWGASAKQVETMGNLGGGAEFLFINVFFIYKSVFLFINVFIYNLVGVLYLGELLQTMWRKWEIWWVCCIFSY